MQEKFADINFRKASLEKINLAKKIIDDYQAEGDKVTLRQLYYQFVRMGRIPNKQNEYDKLSNLISDARRAGLIDWSAIEDRTRCLRGWETFDSPADAIKRAAWTYAIDPWEDQPTYVEVWEEKDALIGTVKKACYKYNVSYFSCRGYASDTAVYEAGKRLRYRHDKGKDIVILHLGDHDPSGIDMSRDILERIELFGDLRGKVDFHRIALNMDQIEELQLPHNPAKETDKRAQAYITKYGPRSWELDALEPADMTNLIQSNIEKYIDFTQWEKSKAREDAEQKEMLAIANNWGA